MTTTRLRCVLDIEASLSTIIARRVRASERMSLNVMISRTEHEPRPPTHVPSARRVTPLPQDGRQAPHLAVGGFAADQRAGGRAGRAARGADRTTDVCDA